MLAGERQLFLGGGESAHNKTVTAPTASEDNNGAVTAPTASEAALQLEEDGNTMFPVFSPPALFYRSSYYILIPFIACPFTSILKLCTPPTPNKTKFKRKKEENKM